MSEIRINRNLARWVLLGLGLIGLVVMAIALLAAPANRFGPVSYVALAVGVLGLVGFVLVDPEAVAKAVTGRTGQYALTTWLMSIFFIFLVVMLFVIVRGADFEPLDLTEAQKYKLHDETIEVLRKLEEPVHVVAFFSDQRRSQRDEAKLWLDQYERNSNGMLTYEFVDPDRNPRRAEELGGRDGVVVFTQSDRTAEAAFVDEATLTTALVRVQLGEKSKLYVVIGHGERSTEDFAGTGYSRIGQALARANFEIETLNLFEQGGVPEDADVVLIAGPTAQFSAAEIEMLDEYLSGGGALMLLLEPSVGPGMAFGVLGVSYSPDGARLVTAGADGTARVWDAQTGDELLVLHGHTSGVLDASFSADGKQIATAGADGTVRVWDAQTGEQLLQLEGQTDLVQRVAYSPDGSLLVSIGNDQVINVWRTDTYEPTSYSPFSATVPLFAVAFSPDGSQFAAGGARSRGSEGVVFVWDAATGEEVFRRSLHTDLVFGLTFAPDGKTLHSVALDGTEGILDLETGEGRTLTLYPNIGITAIAIAPDGTKIYALGDNSIHLRKGDTDSTEDDVILTGHRDVIYALRLAPDGESFVTGSNDGDARVWSLKRQSNTLLITGHSGGDPLLEYLANTWGIQANKDIVIDVATSGVFGLEIPIVFNFDSASPITRPLRESAAQVIFPLARSLQAVATPPTDVTLTSLATTSPQSGGQINSWGETNTSTNQVSFDEQDHPGPVTLAYSAENAISDARLVVVGDADFASNDTLQQSPPYSNTDFFLNIMNWLTEREFELPPDPEAFTMRTLNQPLSQGMLIVIGITSTCLIPLAAAIVGAAVWISRQRKR